MIALYIRTKTKCDNELNPNIIKQRTLLRRYAKLKHKEFKYYVDEGYSGFDYNRPSLNNLINDLKYFRVNEVVVVDTYRLGRDNKAFQIFDEYIWKNNIKYTVLKGAL